VCTCEHSARSSTAQATRWNRRHAPRTRRQQSLILLDLSVGPSVGPGLAITHYPNARRNPHYKVEGAIIDRGLNVRTEAIEATLEEIRKDTPKAALAKPGDFVDLRFVNELKQSGYLERIWK